MASLEDLASCSRFSHLKWSAAVGSVIDLTKAAALPAQIGRAEVTSGREGRRLLAGESRPPGKEISGGSGEEFPLNGQW